MEGFAVVEATAVYDVENQVTVGGTVENQVTVGGTVGDDGRDATTQPPTIPGAAARATVIAPGPNLEEDGFKAARSAMKILKVVSV